MAPTALVEKRVEKYPSIDSSSSIVQLCRWSVIVDVLASVPLRRLGFAASEARRHVETLAYRRDRKSVV